MALPAMSGLMKDMYENWKEKIGEANRKETQAKKKKYAGKIGVDIYQRMEDYAKKQRELVHHQYHTQLKIMHSGMQKFKSVMQACDSAVAGKKPNPKDLRAMGLMPDIVFLQTQVSDISTWASGALIELRA